MPTTKMRKTTERPTAGGTGYSQRRVVTPNPGLSSPSSGALTRPNATKIPTSSSGPYYHAGSGGTSSGGANTSTGNSGGTTDSNKTLADVYAEEIRKAQEEKNYKLLLDSTISAYNLTQQSNKYLANELRAQGLNTQGYGTSAQTGLSNEYLRALSNANNTYLESQRDLELAELEDEANRETEQDNQLVTYLNNAAGNAEQIAQYMANYGYALNEEDGKWYKTNEDGSIDLSRPASAYIQSAAYAAQTISSSDNPYDNTADAETRTIAEQLLAATGQKDAQGNYLGVEVNAENGWDITGLRDWVVTAEDDTTTKPLKNVVGNELDYLEERLKTGVIADGTLFKLQRGNGSKEAYLVLYYGGKLYIVSTSDDEHEGGQVATYYDRYTGPKEEIKDK